MQLTTATAAPTHGWLRSPGFDSVFIVGIMGLALLVGFIVVQHPTSFGIVLTLNLWLLGYHHVIATYTRLVFDRDSFQQHKALVLYLPIAVLLATGLIGATLGAKGLFSIYLYWQWWHYTRQSEGIAKAYAKKSEQSLSEPDWLTKIIFWVVPIDAIVNLTFKSPGAFLGLPIYGVPIPYEIVYVLDCAAMACLALWSYQQFRALKQGKLALPYTLYVFSHFMIFYIAYVFVRDINIGWLIVNVWHNAQYIAFVWLFNQKRFKDGVDPERRFLSAISQPNRLVLYLGVCLAISTSLYYGFSSISHYVSYNYHFMFMIIIYQTINFHHYIVDSVIWKLRKKSIQTTLGLT